MDPNMHNQFQPVSPAQPTAGSSFVPPPYNPNFTPEPPGIPNQNTGWMMPPSLGHNHAPTIPPSAAMPGYPPYNSPSMIQSSGATPGYPYSSYSQNPNNSATIMPPPVPNYYNASSRSSSATALPHFASMQQRPSNPEYRAQANHPQFGGATAHPPPLHLSKDEQKWLKEKEKFEKKQRKAMKYMH